MAGGKKWVLAGVLTAFVVVMVVVVVRRIAEVMLVDDEAYLDERDDTFDE